MFGQYITAIRALGRTERDRFLWALVAYIGATITPLIFIVLASPSAGWAIAIEFPFWVFTALTLFAVRRYIRVHIAGEVLETIRLTPDKKGLKGVDIFDNSVAQLYRRWIVNLFFLQTSLFLGVPLYLNYTQGGRALLFMIIMVTALISMASTKAVAWIFRMGVIITILIFSVIILARMFPQITVWSGMHSIVPALNGENSAKINDINELRSQQTSEIIRAELDGVMSWQKKHPGDNLPSELQEKVDAAKYGMTAAQWRSRKTEKEKLDEEKHRQTYVPPHPPTQISGAAPAAFAPPAPAPVPAPEPQRKDVSGLPTFLVCEGHQNGPCFGKLRREEGTFYDEGGDIIFSATNYTAVPGFQVGNQIRGEGQKKGGEIIPFRAIRRNG